MGFKRGIQMKKEHLTHDELGLAATGLDAKIQELESAIGIAKIIQDESLLEESRSKLQEYKYLQQKLFRLYKFQ